jgi:hypothetical protein
MKAALRIAIAQEMESAGAAEASGDFQRAIGHLERAHVLGQRYFLIHMHTHLCMLRIALRRHDTRELQGQAIRLLAVIPGYITGWIPKGNTGGANVSALKPMPIPTDLAPLLSGYSVWRDVGVRFIFVILAASVYNLFVTAKGPQSPSPLADGHRPGHVWTAL